MLAPSAEAQQSGRLDTPKAESTTELETLLELGQGGMATAYLARALGTGGFERLVVLKRLSGELAGNRDAVRRFHAEARVAARLHHVNVVGTHQIGSDEAGPFIVLDYVEGGSLSDVLEAAHDAGEHVPVAVVLRVGLDVLAALRAVHEATDGDGRPLGILHRDVSLENVLVGVSDGVARLSDFGVAKSTLGPTLTDPGCFVGKVLYFAPEYLLREPVGPPLDLYALGVTLWLALTGDELWPQHEGGELARAIVDEGVPSLDGHRAVTPEIRDFVARACARDARARFRSAREMAAALQELERRGAVAPHAEVAAFVERMLGERLRERRATLARLAPELAGPPSAPLALRETLRDARQSVAVSRRRIRAPETLESAPERQALPAHEGRVRTLVIPGLLLALIALTTSLLLRAPERAPGAPHVIVSEVAALAAPTSPEARTEATPAPPPLVTPAESAPPAVRPTPARVHFRTPSAKRPPASAATTTPAGAPSGIARKNPYR